MSDIKKLYQEIILDHQKHPKNFGRLENPTNVAEKNNPLCGDQIHVDVSLQENQLDEIKFHGNGCAICLASTSIMTEMTKDQKLEEIQKSFDVLKQVIDRENQEEIPQEEKYQILNVFEGVRKFPSRKRCATLGWEALLEAVSSETIIN